MPNYASFLDGGAAVGTVVNLTTARSAGKITFDAGSKTYTLTGSSLQLAGAGGIGITARSNAIIQCAIQVTDSQTWDIASNVTVAGVLALGSNTTLTKKGSGNLLLSGPQNHSPDTQIKMMEGSLHLAANLGQSTQLAIQGPADAIVVLDSDQDLANLTIATADSGQQSLDLSSPTSPGAFRSLRIHAVDLT